MKEPEIVKAINSLEGVSDVQKNKYVSIVQDTFFYNPDDYYNFMSILSDLNVSNYDQFFSELSEYLRIRKSIEDRLNSIIVKNKVAKNKFTELEDYCRDIKTDLDGLIHIEHLMQRIIGRFTSNDIKEMKKKRDEIQARISDKNLEIDARKRKADADVERYSSKGGIFSYFKAKLHRKKTDKEIELVMSDRDKIEEEYTLHCRDIVEIFHDEVDNLSETDKELLTKYVELAGYENFFAIKYDLTWFLHKDEPGRLYNFVSAIGEEIKSYQTVLSDELDSASELKKKIDSRDHIIENYEDHLDLFNISEQDIKMFKDYTKRYPNLRNYSVEELSELDEQKDARILLPIITTLPVKEKKKSLTR